MDSITIILLALIFFVLDVIAIMVSAEDNRFDEIDTSCDIVDVSEWEELDDEIEKAKKRGDNYY